MSARPPQVRSTSANLLRLPIPETHNDQLITYTFPDFRAVKYFQKEFVLLNEFHVVEPAEVRGFEIYLVDQWIRERRIGSVVLVYTGNDSKVKATRLTIERKPSKEYPPRFQEYLNEMLLNHATFKKMEGGDSEPTELILVTNISAMPHNLDVIPLPSGDARAVELTYTVNSNLKKCHCGGRSLSLLADKVSDASEDKFRQMYRIYNEAVPIQFAVLEIVNLVQTCLFYFDLLDAKYADGLLCQKTEDAIENWWNIIGLPHFNSKPDQKAGVLSSRTVAAILSLTVSIKLRLHLFGGCDVPKDIFDSENFMISIGQFQKQVKLEKRRKLDLLTLLRLFYYTSQGSPNDKFTNFYTSFGNDLRIDDLDSTLYDSSFMPQKTMIPAPAPGQTASAYRRNKLYYSKELKKLTNVVKNTVQDHIIVKEDIDDIYAEPSSNTKLRSKLASKLTDTVVPSDVETTDIEVFFKKCVSGKYMLRLWHGLSGGASKFIVGPVDGEEFSVDLPAAPQDDSQNSSDRRHHHHHHHRHSHRLHNGDRPMEIKNGEQSEYRFVSFRDSIAMSQELNQSTDKAGRLGRMRFALQGKKGANKTDLALSYKNAASANEPSCLLLDAELQKLSEKPPSIHNGDTSQIRDPNHQHQNLLSLLNRRNSYPFLPDGREANLNLIEFLQVDEIRLPELKKSPSFSSVEQYFHSGNELSCLEKLKSDYLNQVSNILYLERLKKESSSETTAEIEGKLKRMNIELSRLRTLLTQTGQRRNQFQLEYFSLLDLKMRDLAENLDRMAFRSRDLVKKIDELDLNLQTFQTKLQTECLGKVDGMIERLVYSNKFSKVFDKPGERQEILVSLVGERHVELPNPDAQKYHHLRKFSMFLYEIMLVILQVFNFDRSNMNLERIRSQYRRLDPNRRYISKIYDFVGRDLIDGACERLESESSTHSSEPRRGSL